MKMRIGLFPALPLAGWLLLVGMLCDTRTYAANDDEDAAPVEEAAQANDAVDAQPAAQDDSAEARPVPPNNAAFDDIWGDESDDAIPSAAGVTANTEWEVVDQPPNTMPDNIGDDAPTVRRVTRPANASVSPSTIVAGRPVAAGSTPWQAEIYAPDSALRQSSGTGANTPKWLRKHICSGALIAVDWVVTAAHCITQDDVDRGFRVRLGAEDISDDSDGVTFRIDHLVRHANYSTTDRLTAPNMYADDIALLHIVQPQPANAAPLRPIDLHGVAVDADTPVTVTVWDKVSALESQEQRAVLMKNNMLAMANASCQQLPGYGAQRIHNGVFCASNPRRKTCTGDSGGPVVLTDGSPRLVGIVSWVRHACTQGSEPGVYTRVAAYTDWIERAMRLPPGTNSLP